jgi:hypothetical protein
MPMLIQDALRPGCGFGSTEWGLDDLALNRRTRASLARVRRAIAEEPAYLSR